MPLSDPNAPQVQINTVEEALAWGDEWRREAERLHWLWSIEKHKVDIFSHYASYFARVVELQLASDKFRGL